MGADYTQEKFWQAVECLISSGPIQERLARAGGPLLRLHGGDPAFQGHPEIQERFEKLLHDLTSVPAKGSEGTLASTTRALPDGEARRIAEEVFGLFCSATDLAECPVGFESRRRGRVSRPRR